MANYLANWYLSQDSRVNGIFLVFVTKMLLLVDNYDRHITNTFSIPKAQDLDADNPMIWN